MSSRPAFRRWGRSSPPLVIAHRGASAERTENTLAAFRRARELGADGIELDAMRCGSGEVVVFHDDDLVRLAGRREQIRETPLAALRAIDLVGGERIPTLDEVIETAGPELLINLELKSPERRGLAYLDALIDDGLAAAVATVIGRHQLAERALVSSFDPLLLARFRRCLPAVARGLLLGAQSARPLREGWAAPLLAPASIHPEAGLIDRRVVSAIHRAGRAVYVWTVDDPRELACVAAWGVDGVITNRPAEARRWLQRTTPPGEVGSTSGA